MRGIKTLALRVERAQETAAEVARFLASHPRVKRLYYPGLAPRAGEDPVRAERARRDNAVHASQSSGAGCVMSFETGAVAISRRFIDSLRIFKLTVSFGSVNSLCEMPCMLSHASIPADQRKLPDDLVRLSIGIESAADVIADIRQAFELAENPEVVNVRAVRRKDTQEEAELMRYAAAAAAAVGADLGLGAATPAASNAAASAATPAAATVEDAAAVSRGEVRKLQGVVKYLRERLADAEISVAEARARVELGLPGGTPFVSAAENREAGAGAGAGVRAGAAAGARGKMD